MSTLTPMRCPSCASNLRAQDLDAARGIATCSYCGALMNLAASTPAAAAPAFVPRPEVPLPGRITVTKREQGLELRLRWFRPAALFLLGFAIIWDGFLFFWYSMAVAGEAPWILFVFPLIHVAVGIGITYTALATLLNTTRIQVGRRELTVHSGPLPWRGSRRIERSRIAQLYGRRKLHHGRNGPQASYELWVALTDGSRSRLLGMGLDEDQTLYLEQRLEQALGLQDRPEAGELPR